ncbi:MAG: T9SS type A sorting domain-containing protein [Sphingobacteriaceae bacterium]|nr:T9SS type A sorting domain-containing protein [Sphingobacteriaceae bacterium]
MKIAILVFSLILTGLSYGQTFPVGHMSINFKDASRTGGYVISGGINVTGTGRDVGTEVYYPSTTAGNNQPVALGQFPIVVIGHGFVMGWDSYDNIYNQLASKGYIVLLPRTEGGFSPSHSEFGNDLKFLVNAGQSLNTVSSPTNLSTFNGKVLPTSAIGGHSMGGGSSFLASASNPSVTCIFNFAPATTSPSSISSASLITVPALVISGAIDCVADTTVQNSHYSALASTKKFHIILKSITHCDFGNGTNFNCTFGQNSTGCSSVVSSTLAFPRYMNYVQNFLDNQLKGDCAAGQRFMDSVNTSSSLRSGLKKMGTIACVATSVKQLSNNINLNVYPNPSNSNIYIDSPLANFKLKLFDLYGRQVLSRDFNDNKNIIELNIEEFESGIYILELQNQGEKHQFKIIKN